MAYELRIILSVYLTGTFDERSRSGSWLPVLYSGCFDKSRSMSAQVPKVVPLWGDGASTRSGPFESGVCPFGPVLSVSSQLIVCPLRTCQGIVVSNYERSAFNTSKSIQTMMIYADSSGQLISRFRAFETRELSWFRV